jgi:diguanylate cyclase (GGDEF)-like protein
MARRPPNRSPSDQDSPGPRRGARRLAELAANAGSASEVYDVAAEELLGLDGVVEVHVQRLGAAIEPGVAVAYSPGTPQRRRVYAAGPGLSDVAQRALAATEGVIAHPRELAAEVSPPSFEQAAALLLRVGPAVAPRALITVIWESSTAAPGMVPDAETLASVTGAAVAALEGRLESSADPHTGCLNEAAMAARLDEEINRARRQGTPLSCLLLALDDLEAITLRHGAAMSAHTLGHLGAVLRREFRRFDRVAYLGRGEFAVLLAGSAGTQAEVVARRALERVHAIKLEEAGERRALRSSVGLGEWHDSQGAWELVASARAALLRAGQREPDGLMHAPLRATMP